MHGSIGWTSVYPRERGERGGEPVLNADVTRFIPANAGNSCSLGVMFNFHTVYPRERGERDELGKSDDGGTGLSPRTRGTAPVSSTAPHLSRFIPANAGNGDRAFLFRDFAAVYPRERGERVL